MKTDINTLINYRGYKERIKNEQQRPWMLTNAKTGRKRRNFCLSCYRNELKIY